MKRNFRENKDCSPFRFLLAIATINQTVKKVRIFPLRGEPVNFCEIPASSARPRCVAMIRFSYVVLTKQ